MASLLHSSFMEEGDIIGFMEQTKLTSFVAERLKAGASPDAIKQHLLLVGWSEEEAGTALVSGLVASGVPTPENRAHSGRGTLSSTVEVVLNFFSFILLGTVATALGILYYNIIGRYFPDPLVLGYGALDYSSSAIHYAIATLIIAFPIYVMTVRLWFRRFRENEEKVESKLTKWLTYLVLLVTAVTIVGDLIASVFYFLQGELSVRFILKALTILVIAGLIFGFYVLERKKIQYKNAIPRRTFEYIGGVISILVVLGIIIGFFAGGSPAVERMRGLDTQRVDNLRSLASCISSFGYERKRLPESIGELSSTSQFYCSGGLSDPETGAQYEYKIITPDTQTGTVHEAVFELCADFATASDATTASKTSYAYPVDKWATHAAGRECDSETVVLDRGDTVPSPVMLKS
ncbi:MAG: hypothetical protein UY04_C0020G0004 [Parcubacteria group bacterium GW2011_GWA2_47_7]|nr:MAG: hypothetical protein UY04_C0020G0004 [Parcubacteria group bacterium GW2011_GWA2_47_7]